MVDPLKRSSLRASTEVYGGLKGGNMALRNKIVGLAAVVAAVVAVGLALAVSTPSTSLHPHLAGNIMGNIQPID